MIGKAIVNATMKSYISETALQQAEEYDVAMQQRRLAIGRQNYDVSGSPPITREWRRTSDVVRLMLDRYGSKFDLSRIHMTKDENYRPQNAINDITSMLIGYDVCTLNSNRKKSDDIPISEETNMEEFLSIKTSWVQAIPKTTWYTFEDVVSVLHACLLSS